ncbi:MAG: DAK2 domain-containing protein [Clostridia bacterium]|nr:DAK2 domain-containing protein [Clostridia bacterium]MBR2070639.1 DAK2 domain-containing protein [Clostridia bacterium]MBR2874274.1 DAK2 domain-containing protein [Clostridia bacterium]MBR6692753.1 DAK2 domain-containing protein [Clostridia bacterium]
MIKSVNAALFRKMFIGGVKNLERNKELVDSLNVFPVPDGDTGTNMSLTLQSAVSQLNNLPGNDMDSICDTIAKGALRGARGNSGVITSQILKGFCQAIKKAKSFDNLTLAKAFGLSTEIAYSAVTKPQEGTILTVIRMMAEYAAKEYRAATSFDDFFAQILAEGENALNKTPEILPVLKKAGVVDAGGKGLLVFLRGMYIILTGGEIEGELPTEKARPIESSAEEIVHGDFDLGNIEFAYCTEFFVINIKKKTTNADIDRFRQRLLSLGDCVVVVGDLEFIKVHVHTNQPGVALSYALELGEIDKIKIENMLEQNRALIEKYQAEKKEQGMLAICAGEGLASIFKDLNVDRVIEGGQTMNPSANDICEAVKRINANHIFVFPNNKNIILAAEQAKALIEDKTIHVIPTKNVPQGIACALNFDPEANVDDNTEMMLEALHGIMVGQVTYAVRSTNVDGFDLTEGDIIGLDNKKILAKGNDVGNVVEALVKKIKKDDHQMLTLYYGHDVKEEEANELRDTLQDRLEDIEVDVVFGGQPLYYYILSLE